MLFKRSKFKSLFLSLALLLSIFSMVRAEPYHAFSVEPIFPENQIEGSSGYFDILLSKNESQTLHVKISNNGDKEMVASAALFNAATGANATGLYNEDVSSVYEPFINTIGSIRNDEVVVGPGETSFIEVDIKVQDEDIEGLIIGGINITADYVDNVKEHKDVDITNRISYLTLIRIRSNIDTVDHNLNHVSTLFKVIDEKHYFSVDLENDRPTHMGNISLIGDVKYEDNIISSINIENGEILPLSSFSVLFSSGQEKLKPGKYNIDLKVIGNQDTWHIKDSLTISEEEAKDFNNTIKYDFSNVFLYIIISILLLIIFILFIILLKNRKKNSLED